MAGARCALFVGWRIEKGLALREADLAAARAGTLWLWLLRVPVPLAIALILIRAAAG